MSILREKHKTAYSAARRAYFRTICRAGEARRFEALKTRIQAELEADREFLAAPENNHLRSLLSELTGRNGYVK